MNTRLLAIVLFAGCTAITSCNSGSTTSASAAGSSDSSKTPTMAIKEQAVTYLIDGKTYDGYVYFDSGNTNKRPGIIVVPEWWGLNDYPRMRAKKLAELGYIAMAADMYGDGKLGTDPKSAGELASTFYKDPALAIKRLNAAINELKTFAETDTSEMAAIGYCFGGYVVLNAAKEGADLKGVVSFHGDLSGVAPDKKMIRAKILVCHGDSDSFVNAEVPGFKKAMDSAGIDYTFKSYPNATHAFTNPAADENARKFGMPIRYNPAADTASWNDMKEFFKKIF
ncbi:MAG TPA: dienelactone hydrolase family protein [Chitinophagaceae bacterium]|nr:dienelactone hydrolase family protein [Chitinophagaceae bacterium]